MSSRARRFRETGSVELYDWAATCAPSGLESQSRGAVRPAADPREAVAADDQQRLAAIERDAFTKGYAQGERAGAEVGATRADAMLRRLTQTLEELAALRTDMIRRTERQIVQLAMAIANRVLQRELSVDRTLLVAMARVALDRLGEQASATIRLNPEDYRTVMAGREPTSTSEQVQIVADPVVSRGGCLVQSDFGLMDVSLDGQFRELSRTLLGERDDDAVPDPSEQLHAIAVPK